MADGAEPDPGDGRQSLVGGFFACVWEEIKGLFELAYLMVMLRAEIAIAADGSIVDWDLIFGSLGGDLEDVYRHIEQIERGDMSGLNRMDADQRAAVLRVRQKLEAIKKAFEDASEASVDFLAAWDVHIEDEDYGFTFSPSLLLPGGGALGEKLLEIDDDITLEDVKREVQDVRNVDMVLPANLNAAMSMIAEALSDSYSDAEWRMRADRGLASLQAVIDKVIADAAANPWGTAGKAICIIALTVIPIGALTKVGRALKIVFSKIDDLPLGSRLDIDDALRQANPDGPSPDTTPDIDTTPEPDTTPEASPTADEIIDGETPGNTTRADAPDRRETPETDGDTTNVPETDTQRRARLREQGLRAGRAGDLAEADARRRLIDQEYEVFELKNELGHGPDIIAIKDGKIRVIEVKANGGDFSRPQALGGPEYMRDVFRRINNGEGPAGWNVDDLADFLEDNGIRNRNDLLDADFEIWRYKNVDGDNPASVGRPEMAPWTAGSPAQRFEIDADGNKYTVNPDGSISGPRRRPWKQPEE